MNATGLTSMMDRLLGSDPAEPLAGAGPYCTEFAAKFADEQYGSQLIATYFWWSFIRSSIAAQVLARTFGAGLVEPVVVIHGGGTRFSLLLIAPGYRGRPRTAWLKPNPAERFVRFRPGSEKVETAPGAGLVEGAKVETVKVDAGQVDVAPRLISAAVRREFGRRPAIQDTDLARAAGISTRLVTRVLEEAGRRHRFGMALVPEPSTVVTAKAAKPLGGVTSGTPTPVVGVHSAGTREPHATIGYTGIRNAKPYGTTVLHALDPQGRVFVKGEPVTVLSRDALTDSCVIQLNGPVPSFCGLRGPVTGSPPRLSEEGHFHGAGSAEERIVLNGYTADIVEPEPATAVKLFTEPHTSPGDSGAALVDGDDRVIGFAVDRSTFSVDHATSSWGWAAQVLARHRLS